MLGHFEPIKAIKTMCPADRHKSSLLARFELKDQTIVYCILSSGSIQQSWDIPLRQVIIKKIKKMYFLSEDFFTLTNHEDPDEMLHIAAFHLDVHCL